MLEPVAPGTAEAKPDPVAPEPGVPDPVSPAQLNTKGLSTEESNTEREGKTPPHRKRYGRYRNVQLSDADLIQLKEEFPGTGSRGLRDCPSIWLPAVRATGITWQPFAAGPEGMPPSRSREPTVTKTIDMKEMTACDHSGHSAARPIKSDVENDPSGETTDSGFCSTPCSWAPGVVATCKTDAVCFIQYDIFILLLQLEITGCYCKSEWI